MLLIPQAFQNQRPAPRWGQGLLWTCPRRSRCCWGCADTDPRLDQRAQNLSVPNENDTKLIHVTRALPHLVLRFPRRRNFKTIP